jgi:hypothetical protein
MNLWSCLVNKCTENSTVQVMHQTVLEFFRSSGPTARSKFQISKDNADLRIAITCIRYLMPPIPHAQINRISGLGPQNISKLMPNTLIKDHLSTMPFINYALSYLEKRYTNMVSLQEFQDSFATSESNWPQALLRASWRAGFLRTGAGRLLLMTTWTMPKNSES